MLVSRHSLLQRGVSPTLALATPQHVVVLPASLVPAPLATSLGWESAQVRRTLARESFRLDDTGALNEFTLRLQNRQERLLEIRRAQFEAEQRLYVAGEAQKDRDSQQESVLKRMSELQADLGLARAQYEISRALASPENDTLMTPDNPTLIAAEVAKLQAGQLRAAIQVDPKTGVRRARVLWPSSAAPRNVRVLYAASRDALKELCDTLETQIRRAETDAEATRVERANQREEDIRKQVNQRLEGIRAQNESRGLPFDQEDSLGKTLLAEALPTRRASVPTSALPSPPPLRLPSPPLSPTLTAERRPVRALQEEVRAAVLDEAARRGIQVRFSPAPGVPDRTAEFANWIKVALP